MQEPDADAEMRTAQPEQTKAEQPLSIEAVITRSNRVLARQRVIENKCAPGVNTLGLGELKDWLKRLWPTVKAAPLDGSFIPRAIRRVELPKPNGVVRVLGIPTAVDRLIQQAIQ
ncbi:hypothetical protein [Sodalis sp. C49]|uniref:hypothetical protein n=2 Tax=Sodalis TaxID=84565 RepID=UPI003965B911